MITQATKEQWNNVERIKDWWLTTQLVEQYSDETMRASASAMLSAMGQSVPLILCVSSPIEARLYSGVISRLNSKLNSKLNSQLDSQLRSQLSSQLRSQLNSKLNSKLDSQLSSQLRSQLRSQLWSQLDSQLWSQLDSQLWSQLDSQLRSQLSSQLRSQLDSQLDSQLSSQLRSQLDLYCGLWWRTWAGCYEGATVLGVEFENLKYELFRRFCLHCPIWMWDQSAIYLLRNPTEAHWNDGLLHRDGGPAVKYSTTFALWSLNGVSVPQWLAETPSEQLDCKQVVALANVEQRREGVRKIGTERLLYKLGSKTLDTCGEMYTLVEIDLGLRRPVRALKMANPSMPEVWHVEFVPPSIETVQEALNFRNGFTAEQIDDENGSDWIQQGDVLIKPAGATKFKSRPAQLT